MKKLISSKSFENTSTTLEAPIKQVTYSKKQRSAERAARVKRVAEMFDVDVSHVNKVLNGTRMNDEIIDAYIKLETGENLLVSAVKKLVKFQ